MTAVTATRDTDREAAQSPLRLAVRTNAAFCSLSGAAIAAFSGVLPGRLGAGSSGFYLGLGLFLVLYGVQLFFLSRRERIRRLEGILVVAGDAAWVAGSAVVAAAGILTPTGVALVLATAAVVGGFAVWQGRHLPAGG